MKQNMNSLSIGILTGIIFHTLMLIAGTLFALPFIVIGIVAFVYFVVRFSTLKSDFYISAVSFFLCQIAILMLLISLSQYSPAFKEIATTDTAIVGLGLLPLILPNSCTAGFIASDYRNILNFIESKL